VLAESVLDTARSDSRVFVFPDSNDNPAGLLEGAVHSIVAFPVRKQLWCPVVAVSRWRGSMLAAAVPVAAIYEHGDMLPGERYVDVHSDGTGVHEVVLAKSASATV